ncbi:DNA-binding protein [Micromonospora sp. L31]|uniref:DNA-binding protein n=1 Tax=Micromonospora sp. L31 TaxID=3452213 RepID=UPI003F88D470
MSDMDIPPAVGAPARRALAGAGWTRLDQLTAVTERELRALHGMGPKAIGVLRAALRDRGLSLAGEQADT